MIDDRDYIPPDKRWMTTAQEGGVARVIASHAVVDDVLAEARDLLIGAEYWSELAYIKFDDLAAQKHMTKVRELRASIDALGKKNTA